jgi:hypothetical protein
VTVQTSAVGGAIDYLVTAATAAFPGILVLDGPPRSTDQEDVLDVVAIGWDGNDEAVTDAVDGTQDYAALNRVLTKDDTFTIVCSVMHWDGTDAVKNSRNGALALLATFEKLMRGNGGVGTGDATLGGAVLFAGIGSYSLAYTSGPNGAACRVIFHVVCRARLTGA